MNEVNNNKQYQPMTIKDWLLTLILMSLPLVGIIMMFVWAFSGGTHPSKQSWAKAYLIFMAIWSALIFCILLPAFWWFLSAGGDYENQYYEENHHYYYDEKY